MIIRITAEQFETLGLELAGFTRAKIERTCQRTNRERFRTWYGISSQACSALFEDLQTTAVPGARINKARARNFLMTLNWLTNYRKEAELAGHFKMDEKTARKHIWTYTKAFQALKVVKITMSDLDDGGVFILTVDGVHFRICEPHLHPDAKWFSPKFKGPGLTYELGIAIRQNRLVWINGPFLASTHDKTIYNKTDGLKSQMPAGKKGIADRGYRGEPTLSTRNDLDTEPVRDYKRRARARHETFNGRLKRFKILDERFRHGFQKHKVVMESVCVLVQYDMENGHPLFDV